MKNAGRFPLMALFALACAGLGSAQDAAPNDTLVLLRQARSLRCTYTASYLDGPSCPTEKSPRLTIK